jgi:hypothetical protein
MYHFFPCAARNCKSDSGGCRRFQDKADRASTSNLKAHAIGCFGAEAVKLAISSKEIESRSGSIFTAFARQGQKPVAYSHRAHTNTEVRARIVKWVTENNRPANIVKDRELIDLFCAGRPQVSIPSPITVGRDIASAFAKCQTRIAKLLQDHPGRLHFATDAWTSPNHRGFVAWTVHLQHKGVMLAFLLDIIEVPEVSRLSMPVFESR